MDIWEDRDDLLLVRSRVLMMAYSCHNLDWLFLTKRPENINRLLEKAKHSSYPHNDWKSLTDHNPRYNWWYGCTVENMKRAEERIDQLINVSARIRFLSCEPLLEPLDLTKWLKTGKIHWVIVGGESNQGGLKARSMHLEWVEEIVNDCSRFNIPVFVKQMGSLPIANGLGIKFKAKQGGDISEWPEFLQKRELPLPF